MKLVKLILSGLLVLSFSQAGLAAKKKRPQLTSLEEKQIFNLPAAQMVNYQFDTTDLMRSRRDLKWLNCKSLYRAQPYFAPHRSSARVHIP